MDAYNLRTKGLSLHPHCKFICKGALPIAIGMGVMRTIWFADCMGPTSLHMLCKVGRIQSANQMCITTSSIQIHLQSCATAIIGMGVMRRIWFN